MKKGFEIFAADEDMANRAQSLYLLNEFKCMGFTDRKGFLTIVLEKMPELDNRSGINRLQNFWAGRDFSINEEIDLVLDLLKLE